MQIGIVAQQDNPRAASLAGDIQDAVDVSVIVDETTAGALDTTGIAVEEMSQCDLVVSIGGDGTFLYAARWIGSTPIMGVNLGEVGFLNATAPENAVSTVKRAIENHESGDSTIRTLDIPRLSATGDGWTLPPALNEIAVMGSHRGPDGGLTIEVRVDGSLYTGGHADGVLVATPAGSTAYNLSEGGPLIHPGVSGMVLNEMCARDGMPPLVIDPDAVVSVRADDASSVIAVSDGRIHQEIDPPAVITVSADAPPVRIAGPEIDFFTALGKLD
ncbi:NAD(+)/NADH kinase [Halocatena pleomorpha]|uniref:NAD kinase n=1 Tax=Halocatena pleomorpha TaxID=1785090 RepID=A0A3P3R8T2_9EURY|nr:NAD(+)/NADH kinase [Halocatena pleomorpha]RRJ29784.1 NAD(+)/NADH kinase [Halocatena pleomorpha]